MSFDYSGLLATSRKLLAQFGQRMTITRTVNGEYDPLTGTSDTSIQTFFDNGVIFPMNESISNMPKSLIQAGDQQVFFQSTQAPIPTDVLTVRGVNYNVIAVEAMEPGGVNVLYELLVRR